MSVIPVYYYNWDTMRPSYLMDQHFGMGLDASNFATPLTNSFNSMSLMRNQQGYYRPWRVAAARSDIGSTIKANKDKFNVILDVKQFLPEEIIIKVSGNNTISVEGKHEEKQDEHGFISRHFTRKYVLPDGYDINYVESSLSSDGVLNITAPRLAESSQEQRNIPIKQTGGVSFKPTAEPKQEVQETQKE